MRIATWNLNAVAPLAPEREAAIRRAMVLVDADVWVLTETWLPFSPGEGYRLVARSAPTTDFANSPDSLWVAIWSRLDGRGIEVRRDPERMACFRVEAPEQGRRDVVVVGTVCLWGDSVTDRSAEGYCECLLEQAAEWRSLWGHPRACGLCVAGDFNQSLPFVRYYGSGPGEECLEGVLARLGLVCLTHGMMVLEPPDAPTIDHVCVGGWLRPLLTPPARTWAIPTWGEPPHPVCDHHGAYADLEVLP